MRTHHDTVESIEAVRKFGHSMKLMGAKLSGSIRNGRDNDKRSGCWSMCNCKTKNTDCDDAYKVPTIVEERPTSLKIEDNGNQNLLNPNKIVESWKEQSQNNSPPVTPCSKATTSTNYSVEEINLSNPTQETLLQILRCFPFPTPTNSPCPSPRQKRRQSENAKLKLTVNCKAPIEENTTLESAASIPDTANSLHQVSNDRKANSTARNNKKNDKKNKKREPRLSAVESLCRVSVDTMAITALPLDCWLKERLKNWVQLSGHEGSIVPASNQTLWKRRSCSDYNEGSAYRSIMQDSALSGFTPRFFKEIDYKNESFIEIEDLTTHFNNPAIMDIKIGTRTFSECEVKNNAMRNDLYEKMIALNPDEPTEEEHLAKGITKLRYMQFREKESSSASLGFRIEAAKMPGGKLQKSFKKVKTREEVIKTLWAFFGERAPIVINQLLARLKRMREATEQSRFFRTHEVVGSSLLFMYDSVHAGVWMIDFAKSTPVEGRQMNHRVEWDMGNHEDGYLVGLDNLIRILEDMAPRHVPAMSR